MELYRGDTFARNIIIKNYELQDNDIIRVGIKKRTSANHYVLPLKELTHGITQFIYSSEETETLIPDKYILEIELTYNNDKVITLGRYDLIVKEDVIHD